MVKLTPPYLISGGDAPGRPSRIDPSHERYYNMVYTLFNKSMTRHSSSGTRINWVNQTCYLLTVTLTGPLYTKTGCKRPPSWYVEMNMILHMRRLYIFFLFSFYFCRFFFIIKLFLWKKNSNRYFDQCTYGTASYTATYI